MPSSTTELVKLQPKGILTIPKQFRDELGFQEKGLLRIIKTRGRLILEPVRALPYSARNYTSKEVEEFLALDKQESRELKKKPRSVF